MSSRPLPLRPPALGGLLVQELVRDWPETLAALRAAGVDVVGSGAAAVTEVAPEGSRALEAVRAATAWRA